MVHDLTPQEAQLVAKFHADVGAEHIADVYAEAFLGAAQASGQLAAMLEEFDSLVTDVLAPMPEFERVLGSALVAHEEKVGLLDRILGPQASPLLLNFLKVLSHHGRLDCLRPIHHQVHELYNRMQGRTRVRLTTPVPINDALATQIAQELGTLLGTELLLDRAVDPDLIGGAVIQLGDTVYDDSIAAQLHRVRQQILDRSAHEIQSRRDRFRHPAGN